MKQNAISNPSGSTFNHVMYMVRSIFTGAAVSTLGIAVWSLLLIILPAPWSVLPMMIFLWAYLTFFAGTRGGIKTRVGRKVRFRSVRLKPDVWKWSIAAAMLFVVIVQSSFVITFRLTDFPSEKFTADYQMINSMPRSVAWIMLVAGSIVAGICEETGFRGYMQVPLEITYGAFTAILVTSAIFTLIHITHSWALPILPHIFFASVLLGILAYKANSLIPGIIGHSILDIFDYSVWWTNITGGFQQRTIFKIGVDPSFVIWCLAFLTSLYLFIWIVFRKSVSE